MVEENENEMVETECMDPNLPEGSGMLGAKHWYEGMRGTIAGFTMLAFPQSDDPTPFKCLTFAEFGRKLKITETTRENLIDKYGSIDKAVGGYVEFYLEGTSKGKGIRARKSATAPPAAKAAKTGPAGAPTQAALEDAAF